MENIDKVLHEDETVLAQAKIAKSFYNPLLKLYALGALLLFIGYKYELGIIGAVLISRTIYVHMHEIVEKRHYHCLLTEERLIILKGYKIKEIFPIELQEIRTIYIKLTSNFFDIGTLEVLTKSGGRYVIKNIKHPYDYHRAIIGDIINSQHYSMQSTS